MSNSEVIDPHGPSSGSTYVDPKLMVAYGDIYDHPSVYVGPRKDDGPVVATFHYGDGKWVVHFIYKKDSKASERAGAQTKSETNTEDKGGKKTPLSYKDSSGMASPVPPGGSPIITQ